MADNLRGPAKNVSSKRRRTTSGGSGVGLPKAQGATMKGAQSRADGLKSYPRTNKGRGKPAPGGK